MGRLRRSNPQIRKTRASPRRSEDPARVERRERLAGAPRAVAPPGARPTHPAGRARDPPHPHPRRRRGPGPDPSLAAGRPRSAARRPPPRGRPRAGAALRLRGHATGDEAPARSRVPGRPHRVPAGRPRGPRPHLRHPHPRWHRAVAGPLQGALAPPASRRGRAGLRVRGRRVLKALPASSPARTSSSSAADDRPRPVAGFSEPRPLGVRRQKQAEENADETRLPRRRSAGPGPRPERVHRGRLRFAVPATVDRRGRWPRRGVSLENTTAACASPPGTRRGCGSRPSSVPAATAPSRS